MPLGMTASRGMQRPGNAAGLEQQANPQLPVASQEGMNLQLPHSRCPRLSSLR